MSRRSSESIAILEDVTFEPLTGTQVLKNVSVKIKKGELLGIIGDISSGKELLVMALNRIVPEYHAGMLSGRIVVCGIDTKDKPVSEMAQKVGVVFRNPITQTLGVTVEEDVAFGPINLGLPYKEIRERINYSLDAVRLSGFERRNPNSLSGGEQQSLAIADLLAMRSSILAMIEPVAMLDPIGVQRVYSVVNQLRKNYGITIIITDSGANIEQLAENASRLIYFEQGKKKLEGAPSKVLQNKAVQRRVGIPQVTELFLKLRKSHPKLPIPAKLDQAIKLLSSRLKGKKIPPKVVEKVIPKVKKLTGKPIIRVRNLKHTYQVAPEPIEALKGVNLDIPKGEIVGMIGQNGAGKTTLSLHLVGLLQPTNPDAEINMAGINVVDNPERATEVANYVFQNPADQLFNETPRQEIAWGLQQRKVPEDEVTKKTKEMIKLFDIGDYADEFLVALPEGVKTRIATASTMVLDPSIAIIDEPTGGLDSTESRKMLGILSEMNKKGVTIILITHDMNLAAEYTQRLIVLMGGNILADGPTREVFSKPEVLRKASLIPPQITRLGQALEKYGVPKDVMAVDEMYNLLEGTI